MNKIKDIIQDLQSLTEEERELLSEFLKEKGGPPPQFSESIPPRQRRKQKRSNKKTEEPASSPRKINKPTKVIKDGKEVKRDKNQQRKQARTEGVALGTERENRYLTNLKEFKQYEDPKEAREARKFDKHTKSLYNRSHAEREVRCVMAFCSKCESQFEGVRETDCYKDEEGMFFICEECNRR